MLLSMNLIIPLPDNFTQIPIIHIGIHIRQLIHLIQQQLYIIYLIVLSQGIQKVPSQIILKLC